MATADRVVWASESSSVVAEQRRVGPADQKQILKRRYQNQVVEVSLRIAAAAADHLRAQMQGWSSKKGRVSM